METSGKQTGGVPDEVAAILPRLIRKTGCDDWTVARSPLMRRDCSIYFLQSASYRLPELVLKIYQKGSVGENLAKSLHRKSKRFHGVGTAVCNVPEPILFLHEQNAMLMECVDAPSAGLLLMKGFHSNEKRRDVILKAGRWLRWFHESSGVVFQPFEAKAFTGPLLKTVERIESVVPTALKPGGLLRKCVESAGEFAAGMEGVMMPHSTNHGDFTPFNLFIHGDRTVGFDFRANRKLPVTHDICRFLLYLDVYQIIPASAREMRRYGCRKNDMDDFMEAYGMEDGWLDDDLWCKLQFMEITRRITSQTLPRTRLRKRLLRFYERARLRRNAGLILDALR